MFGQFGPVEAILLFVVMVAVFLVARWLLARRRGEPVRRTLTTDQEPTTGDSKKETSVFISYRRADSADVVGRIYDRLTERFGEARIFRDVDSIPLGVDFRTHLDRMVGACDILIAVIGDQWVQTMGSGGRRRLDDPQDFVRIEIESALQRGIPVVPVLVQGAAMPSEEVLPASLKDLSYRNAVPVRSDPDFHRDMDRLIAGLEAHLRR